MSMSRQPRKDLRRRQRRQRKVHYLRQRLEQTTNSQVRNGSLPRSRRPAPRPCAGALVVADGQAEARSPSARVAGQPATNHPQHSQVTLVRCGYAVCDRRSDGGP